jgi:hypothetical protein
MTAEQIKTNVEEEFRGHINRVCALFECWKVREIVVDMLCQAYSSGMLVATERALEIVRKKE